MESDDHVQINYYKNKINGYEKHHKELADRFNEFAMILFETVFGNNGVYEVGSSAISCSCAGRIFNVVFTSAFNQDSVNSNSKLEVGLVKCMSDGKVVAQFNFDALGNTSNATEGIVCDSVSKERFVLSFGYRAIYNSLTNKVVS